MAKTTGKKTATSGKASNDGFTAEERAAMKERAKELKSASSKAEQENEVLEKIAAMPEPDRTIAEHIHALVKANAPELAAKTWYGMPAYSRDGKVLCFFQSAGKFSTRYSTFGFNDVANLDDGDLWAVGYAVKAWTPAVEAKITALIKQAMS